MTLEIIPSLNEAKTRIQVELSAYQFVTVWKDFIPQIKPIEYIKTEIDQLAIQIKEDNIVQTRDGQKSQYYNTLIQILKLIQTENKGEIHRTRARLDGILEGLEFAINCQGNKITLLDALSHKITSINKLKTLLPEGASPLWVSMGYQEGLELAISIIDDANNEHKWKSRDAN